MPYAGLLMEATRCPEPQVNKYIYREMINHKHLVHRNIIQFKEVRACIHRHGISLQHEGIQALIERRWRAAGVPDPHTPGHRDGVRCGR